MSDPQKQSEITAPTESDTETTKAQQGTPQQAAGGCLVIVIFVVILIVFMQVYRHHSDDELFDIGRRIAVLSNAGMVLRGEQTIREYLNDPRTTAILSRKTDFDVSLDEEFRFSLDDLRCLEVDATMDILFADDQHREFADALYEQYDISRTWRGNDEYVETVRLYAAATLISAWRNDRLPSTITYSEAALEAKQLNSIRDRWERFDQQVD